MTTCWNIGKFVDNVSPGFKVGWLEYQSLTSAIPKLWKFFLKTPHLMDDSTSKFSELFSHKKVSQWAYRDMMSSQNALYKVAENWYKKAAIDENIQAYVAHFKNIQAITNVVKYRDFQYRLLHNKIFCNDQLVHWKKVQSNICNLCEDSKQTIVHLMSECKYSRTLWEKLDQEFKKLHISCEFNFRNVLFNNVHENRSHVCNFLILVTKQYIFRCKCTDTIPVWIALLNEFKLVRAIERYNSSTSGFTKYSKRWSPVEKMFK